MKKKKIINHKWRKGSNNQWTLSSTKPYLFLTTHLPTNLYTNLSSSFVHLHAIHICIHTYMNTHMHNIHILLYIHIPHACIDIYNRHMHAYILIMYRSFIECSHMLEFIERVPRRVKHCSIVRCLVKSVVDMFVDLPNTTHPL